jgi:hypothetical protein
MTLDTLAPEYPAKTQT